jgi:hypothetical protein
MRLRRSLSKGYIEVGRWIQLVCNTEVLVNPRGEGDIYGGIPLAFSIETGTLNYSAVRYEKAHGSFPL